MSIVCVGPTQTQRPSSFAATPGHVLGLCPMQRVSRGPVHEQTLES